MFHMKRFSWLVVFVFLLSALNGCSKNEPTTSQQAPSAPPLPLASMPKIEPQKVLDHIKVLASDEYEGRAPGTKGEELTVKYLEDQFKKLV